MGDSSDSIEWFVEFQDEVSMSETGTDYWSPCCDFGAVYAHFLADKLVGFQCAECGKDYEKDYEFET